MCVESCVKDSITIQSNDKQIQLFCDYMLDIYISSDSTISPNIWSGFVATTVRTTNGCNPYHSQ